MTAARPEPVVVALAGVPSLGGLYARGVAGSVRPGRSRTVRSDDLPRTRLHVGGVSPDPAHLTDYQRLVGETGSDVLPAGFVHVLAFPVATALMVRGEFPLPLLGMVHLANHVEQRRPLTVTDELDIEVHAEGLAAHRSGVSVDLVATVRADDDVAWVGRSTYLAKGYQLSDGDAADDDRPRESPDAPTAPPTADAPLAPTARWRLAADTGRRYAAVSGDQNPIHTNPLAAKAFGFPRAIAHGMYTAARALAEVGPRARGEAFTWDVTFAKPVLLPSTVDVRIADDGAGHAFRVWSSRSGRTHLEGAVRPLP
ncbi:hypothetical protein GXB85_04980 [Cellulomonas sp. APG4]|uniref:MaoC/PaaZ C-terminal domain-containing protein n=1 Tax=Cellulomonas sp. APG4 TaxID=1538656 RepID=UPI0013799832|nr:hypothetical protein [Cellulomonas sp. APG4]